MKTPPKFQSTVTPESLRSAATLARQAALEASQTAAQIETTLAAYEGKLASLVRAKEIVLLKIAQLDQLVTGKTSEKAEHLEWAIGGLGPNLDGRLWEAKSIAAHNCDIILASIKIQRPFVEAELAKAEKDLQDFLEANAETAGQAVIEERRRDEEQADRIHAEYLRTGIRR